MHPLEETEMDQVPSSSMRKAQQSLARRIRARRLNLIVTVSNDVLFASISVALGLWWSSRVDDITPPFWVGLIYVPIVIVVLAARSTYRSNLNRSFLDDFASIEAGIALSSMLLLASAALTSALEDPGKTVVKIWLCTAVLMPIGRLLRSSIEASLRRPSRLAAPTLIVGNGLVAHQIIDRLKCAPEYGLVPVGLVSFTSPWRGTDNEALSPELPHLGTPDDIEQIIENTGAECIVIAFTNEPDGLLTPAIRVAHRHGLRVWVVPGCSTWSVNRRGSNTSAAFRCWH